MPCKRFCQLRSDKMGQCRACIHDPSSACSHSLDRSRHRMQASKQSRQSDPCSAEMIRRVHSLCIVGKGQPGFETAPRDSAHIVHQQRGHRRLCIVGREGTRRPSSSNRHLRRVGVDTHHLRKRYRSTANGWMRTARCLESKGGRLCWPVGYKHRRQAHRARKWHRNGTHSLLLESSRP